MLPHLNCSLWVSGPSSPLWTGFSEQYSEREDHHVSHRCIIRGEVVGECCYATEMVAWRGGGLKRMGGWVGEWEEEFCHKKVPGYCCHGAICLSQLLLLQQSCFVPTPSCCCHHPCTHCKGVSGSFALLAHITLCYCWLPLNYSSCVELHGNFQNISYSSQLRILGFWLKCQFHARTLTFSQENIFIKKELIFFCGVCTKTPSLFQMLYFCGVNTRQGHDHIHLCIGHIIPA